MRLLFDALALGAPDFQHPFSGRRQVVSCDGPRVAVPAVGLIDLQRDHGPNTQGVRRGKQRAPKSLESRVIRGAIHGASIVAAFLAINLALTAPAFAATCPSGCLELSSHPSTVYTDTGIVIPVACLCEWDAEMTKNFTLFAQRGCFDNRCTLSGQVLRLLGGISAPGKVWVATDSSGHGHWADPVCP